MTRAQATDQISGAFQLALRTAGRQFRASAADVDASLRPAAWGVLQCVLREGRAKPAQIAEELGMDKGSVSHHLRDLERRGFVDRRPDQDDGRSTWIVATSTARSRAARAASRWSSQLDHVIESWTDEEVEVFGRLFERFSAANWKSAAAGPETGRSHAPH